MKAPFSRTLIAFAFGIGFFSWQSCKEQTTVSANLIPPVDNIHTFQLSSDSLGVTMRVKYFDSVRTNDYDPSTSPLIALGQVSSDPFFGQFTAGLYTQFVPPVANFSFPDPNTYSFDSAFIVLPYQGFTYGDTLNPASNMMSYNVYRVTEPMSLDDSNDYTFTDYAYNSVVIGGGTYSFQSMKDTFASGSDTLSNQLRIKLDRNYIYNQIVQIDTSHFTTSAAFTDYFNGWYIAPANNTNTVNRMSYFGLSGANTSSSARVDFYFHNIQNNQTVVYSFPYSSTVSAFVNRIDKSYSGFPVNNFVQNNIKRDSAVLQGFPGTYSLITIRNLNKIPPCIVNQAEVTLTAIPVGQDDKYAVPPHLLIERVLSDGSTTPIADVYGSSGSPSIGGLNFMDGNPKTVTINGQNYTQYVLNFPRELQRAVMAGEDSLTFRISASSIYQGAFRMVAPGFTSQSDAKMKLNIIYTKLK